MNDERTDNLIHALDNGLTRRSVLLAAAGVAGLHVSEGSAKRRNRGSGKRQRQAAAGLSAESQPETVTIATDRFSDALGDFTATGAIDDTGKFTVEVQHFGGIGAPTFLIVDAIYSFAG